MKYAAGILLIDPRGRGLFVRRSDSRLWATPAGHIETGETPWEAAKRETYEETGYSGPYFSVEEVLTSRTNQRTFWLFSARVPRAFTPRLDGEHITYKWRALSNPPEPLHWGLRWLKKRR